MCKKPRYETIIGNYINGNRKDFAFQVKLFDLADFIDRAIKTCAEPQDEDPFFVLTMVHCAVNLGGYE